MTHALTTITPTCCNVVRDYVRREVAHDHVVNHYRCATCGREYVVTVTVTKARKA